MRDLLAPDRGFGRPSSQAERQLRELADPAHPRRDVSPGIELELAHQGLGLAAEDERKTCFDPESHPKGFDSLADPSEPIADSKGRLVDMQRDTTNVGIEIGPTDRDTFMSGVLSEEASFDLGFDELGEVDVL